MTIALASPSLSLFDSWSDTVAEFGDVHIDGAGLERGQSADRDACAAFIEKAELYADPNATLPEGHVACDYFWITDDDEVVGFIAFRRELNDWLRSYGGHIGYSVRPSRRRRGIARAALDLVLDRARAQGYDRVMLTCDDDNVGSYRTIEGAGGELAGVIEKPEAAESGERVRQYWISL
ncbi:GNAT family N-acetyltransferase [Microbacterium esteraromaticum]|uniref:GNAT family N-acetyltransferase n=1 Tax=Microbacterium esteraromaticum TaxID=57043 RepID=A0A7D7WEW3_9MICO|nr:GNAT family N-acetyltransferase [Microbacterium esteraromaticum]QMU97012.1 GNAT family N-acetyltransferase [Microbacterium esteraromaticum]